MNVINWVFNERTKYLIQLNYKSGKSMKFWCYSFTIKNGDYSWESIGTKKRALLLGVDEIESVWQIDCIIGRS